MRCFLILAFLILTIVSYRSNRTRLKPHLRSLRGRLRFVGIDHTTFFSAAVVLLIITLFMLTSDPGRAVIKASKVDTEVAAYRTMARHLTQQLAPAVVEGTSVLVINRPVGEKDKIYHQALVTGVKEALGDSVEAVIEEFIQEPDADTAKEHASADSLIFDRVAFDGIARRNSNCSVVISFIGVPPDLYHDAEGKYIEPNRNKSFVRRKILRSELSLGVLTDNPYLLGQAIFSGELKVCVVPKRNFSYENDEFRNVEDAERFFASRYHLITPENVIDIYKVNRRLFKVEKAL